MTNVMAVIVVTITTNWTAGAQGRGGGTVGGGVAVSGRGIPATTKWWPRKDMNNDLSGGR